MSAVDIKAKNNYFELFSAIFVFYGAQREPSLKWSALG